MRARTRRYRSNGMRITASTGDIPIYLDRQEEAMMVSGPTVEA